MQGNTENTNFITIKFWIGTAFYSGVVAHCRNDDLINHNINIQLKSHKIKIEINSKRPDFRLFWIYLWGDDHNFDSDGDSNNPASKDWTELYMSSREVKNQAFDICKVQDEPLVFEVLSTNKHLMNQVSYFLKRETNGKSNKTDEELIKNMGDDFNLKEALERADNSIWRKSSLENPYPNMK